MSELKLETVPCALGCAPSDVPLFVGHDRLHDLPGHFTVVQCSHCGLARTSPRPTATTIGAYYPADYGPYKSTAIDSDRSSDNGFKMRFVTFVKRFIDVKAHALPPQSVGKMLEIGCASGSFLHDMAIKGWEVEGIEFSPDAAETARALGYRVDIGALETIERPGAQFDLIVGWMVIEHLHDPVGSLRKLAGWIRPNGKLVISVPDAGAAEFRIFRSRWYALHLPNHLFHFDVHSIAKVLKAAGWKVIKIQRHRNMANLIASFGYLAQDKGWERLGDALAAFPERGGRIGAGLLYPISLVMAWLGQTGRMTVWAERLPE